MEVGDVVVKPTRGEQGKGITVGINGRDELDAALARAREQHPEVQPGYHMNKAHWNTVTLDGSIPEAEIWGMIDDSYDLVVAGLSRIGGGAEGPGEQPQG